MGNVAARDQQLSDLVVSLQQFVTGLAGDKDAIFNSLQTIDTLATTTSGFLADARPPLASDITALGQLSGNLADSRKVLEGFLQLAPTKVDSITPDRDQRQLVQLLHVQRVRLRDPAGHRARRHRDRRPRCRPAAG